MDAHVINCKKTGDAWYRMWSDGWIEQGGLIRVRGMYGGGHYSSIETINLPRAFSTVKYNLRSMVLAHNIGGQDGDDVEVTLGEKTRTSFKAMIWDSGTGTDTNNDISWYACGF